ncbi:Ldh family oxidoreductase [Pseudoclavibacter helvolus]|uniref:Ldh family oxidoreductase n=1 Tax=Pseudoclavibacter helvolus TaxID=255205 RepID=UPI003C7343FE
MSASITPQRFTEDQVRQQILEILTAWGMTAEAAAISAEVMVDTDLSGIDSHGISMLMLYEKLARTGRLNINARPEIVHEGPAFAIVDGHDGLGHPTAVTAMHTAIDKARREGVSVVAARSSSHFGALGYYARLASDQGLVALITTTTRTPTTSATNGTTAVLGTNPICFSAPRADGAPLVVDISTSVVALNKVKTYALKGWPLPVGWVTDSTGADLVDAKVAYELLSTGRATISPLGGPGTESGGHKGFGLSLMVQILSAALAGASGVGLGADADNLGHFFLVIDPERLRPDGTMSSAVEEILSATSAEAGVRVPGEPEADERAARTAHGIPLPATLLELLEEICTRAEAPFLLAPTVAAVH